MVFRTLNCIYIPRILYVYRSCYSYFNAKRGTVESCMGSVKTFLDN